MQEYYSASVGVKRTNILAIREIHITIKINIVYSTVSLYSTKLYLEDQGLGRLYITRTLLLTSSMAIMARQASIENTDVLMSVCVCVCVCERERETEGGQEKLVMFHNSNHATKHACKSINHRCQMCVHV